MATQPQSSPSNEPARTYVDALIVVNLILLFALTVVLLGRSIVQDRMNGQLIEQHRAREIMNYVVPRPDHRPAPTSTAVYVQPWMTFDYVNKVFGLPASHLKDALNVRDPRYPNVSISHYAKSIGANPADVANEVNTAVRSALTAPTSTSASATPSSGAHQ
jgi:hypothetical protein